MMKAILKALYVLSILATVMAVCVLLFVMIMVGIELVDGGGLPHDAGIVIFLAIASPCVTLVMSIFFGVLSRHWPSAKVASSTVNASLEESQMMQELYRQGIELERRMEALETLLLERFK